MGHFCPPGSTFFYFCGSFLPSWIRIPNPDQDPLTQLNPYPIRIRIQIRIRNPAWIRIPNPDPLTQLNPEPIRIRIRNPAWIWIQQLTLMWIRIETPLLCSLFGSLHGFMASRVFYCKIKTLFAVYQVPPTKSSQVDEAGNVQNRFGNPGLRIRSEPELVWSGRGTRSSA